VIIEIGDIGRTGLINEGVVDRAYRGATFDTGVAIDREDLLEPLAKRCQRCPRVLCLPCAAEHEV